MARDAIKASSGSPPRFRHHTRVPRTCAKLAVALPAPCSRYARVLPSLSERGVSMRFRVGAPDLLRSADAMRPLRRG